MAFMKAALGLVTLCVVAAQVGSQYNPFPQNNFDLPVGGGTDGGVTPGVQSGVPAFHGQFGRNFIPGGINDDGGRFSGVPAGVSGAGSVHGFNAQQTFGGLPTHAGQGVFSQPSQGSAFIARSGVATIPPRVPVFTGQGGVISLPSQQGPAFVGGQGPSFVGGQVSGQADASGFGFQQGVQAAGFGFPSRVIQGEITPTITQTVTIDAFETLTDLVLHSVAVTRTQFSLVTTTRATRVVVATPVNHGLALSTSVIVRPAYVTVTNIRSDFRVDLRTSVSYVTLTHTSYDITHVPFTLYVTETVEVTSPVVRTVITTSVQAVTSHQTVRSTVYVHGGYH